MDTKIVGASPGSHSEYLREVSLFSSLKETPEAIEALSNAMEEKKFKKGSSITVEGENGIDAFFLVSGKVNISKKIGTGETLPVAALDATHRPFFGESALLERDARSATIEALSDCTCLVFDKNGFDEFCSAHPKWALPIVQRIARVIMQRLRKSNEDVVQLYDALVNEVRGN